MFEILYCIDENYNDQTLVSINTILKNASSEYRIHIVHENPETFNWHKDVLKSKFGYTNVKLYPFNEQEYNFPKVNGSHVSKATYFRLFISNYLDNNIENLLYLDPDVVCLNEFENSSIEIFKKIKLLNIPIAARTEHIVNNKNRDRYKSINVTKSYFNAGVMFIDFKNWVSNKYVDKFLEVSKEIEENIIYWDQDILNSFFNENYLEIPIHMNQHPYNFKDSVKFYTENTVFLHFSGKNKPWTKKGKGYENSKIYFELYKETYGKKLRKFK